MSLRDDYDLPRPSSGLPPLRLWAVMLAVPAAALIVWVVLPDSVVTVVILVVAIILAVSVGILWVLSSRGLREPPPRDPQPRH